MYRFHVYPAENSDEAAIEHAASPSAASDDGIPTVSCVSVGSRLFIVIKASGESNPPPSSSSHDSGHEDTIVDVDCDKLPTSHHDNIIDQVYR